MAVNAPPPINRSRTVDLMDWIKIALAVGLMSVGVQLYAGAPHAQASAAVAVQPAVR
jgi:hypothetical protein